jgi:hypothetical protein
MSKGECIAKPKPPCHGAPVGVLMLERADDGFDRPFVPGSVGNASTWSVPVRFKTIRGVNFRQIIGPSAASAEAAVIEAAADLASEGARLITAHCGFMMRYQQAVGAAVDAQVLLSSLLLGPILERTLPRGKSLGIVTAKASALTPDILGASGLTSDMGRVVVAGLEDAPVFARSFLTASGDFEYDAVEAEAVDAAVAMIAERPDIGMLLLECSELPPFASAVQRATGLPVYDHTSMVEFFAQGLMRKPFTGLG